jgi:hypothetical protein
MLQRGDLPIQTSLLYLVDLLLLAKNLIKILSEYRRLKEEPLCSQASGKYNNRKQQEIDVKLMGDQGYELGVEAQ